MQPFTTSSSKTFQNFVRTLDPTYKIPSRQTTKKIVMKNYDLERNSVSQMLKSNQGMISLTADLWTSGGMDGFCGISAHFINQDWQLQHIVLDIVPVLPPHTGEAIKETLLETIIELDIAEKILAITTDNGPNMVRAIKLLKIDMADKFNQDVFHIRCAAHVINLAVQKGLENISKINEILM